MKTPRIKQRIDDLQKALGRLEEVLKEDPKISTAIMDGTIQRFEFTFELAWKCAKDFLGNSGVEVNSPRAAIKESFKAKLLKDGDGWIEMLEDRNRTAHLYDEDQIKKVYEKIKSTYFPLLSHFQAAIKSNLH